MNDRTVNATVHDAVRNEVTGSGTSRDPISYAQVAPVTLNRQEAINLYAGYWLARKIVDIPIQDMLKNGRTIHDMSQEDQQRYAEVWAKHGCDNAIMRAMKWAFLFGGSGIVFAHSDVELSQPFDEQQYKRANGVRLIVLDATELQPRTGASTITDLSSRYFRRPAAFTYGGTTIDVTHVVVVHGAETPHSDQQINTMGTASFWGQPRMLYAKEPIIHAHSLYGNIAAMCANNNVDIMSVPGLYETLALIGTEDGQGSMANTIHARAAMYALYKGLHNVAMIDSNESIERLKYDFTGLPSLISEYVTAISGLSEIPMTRLSGISPGGLNSTGEADLQNYYNGIAGRQQNELMPIYDELDAVMTLIAFGERRKLRYTINAPHTMSEQQRAELEAKRAESLAKMHATNLAPESAVLARMQRDHLPDITDEWIADVRAEEQGTDPSDDDTDDLGGDPDDDDGSDDDRPAEDDTDGETDD